MAKHRLLFNDHNPFPCIKAESNDASKLQVKLYTLHCLTSCTLSYHRAIEPVLPLTIAVTKMQRSGMSNAVVGGIVQMQSNTP